MARGAGPRHLVRAYACDVQSVGSVVPTAHRAREFDCDLLAMGAYSHSRLRQLILGGVTRHVLERSNLPVMMSR